MRSNGYFIQKIKHISKYLLWGLLIFIIPIIIGIGILPKVISLFLANLLIAWLIIIFLLAIIILVLPILLEIISWCRFLIFRKSKFENLLDNLIQDQYNLSEIEEILSKMQLILKQFRLLKYWKFFSELGKSENENQISREYLYYVAHYCYMVLFDLRSDLKIRMNEIQKTLESVKSETRTHIHGTNELSQVSELQSARLDRQIEQFEELQKVLVKM